MSDFQHKVNSGSLFPPSDKAPPSVQLGGDINIEGKLYYITMWKKDKPDQKQWNITVKPKDSRPAPAPPQAAPAEDPFAPEDEIPFLMVKYVVINDEAKASVVKILSELPVPFELEIADKRKRTLEQNALIHLWAKELADQRQDMNFDEVRAELKLRFGIPILRRDIEAFRETYDRILKPLDYETKIELIQHLDIPVTSVMSVKQLTEMIENVERFYTNKGFHLTAGTDTQRTK